MKNFYSANFSRLFQEKLQSGKKIRQFFGKIILIVLLNPTDSILNLYVGKLVPQFSPIVTGYVFGMVVGKKSLKKRVEMLQEMTLNSRARRSDFYQ